MKPQPPPHNLDAEQAVLGGMLINQKKIPAVKKDLSPEDFYREAHQAIARAMFEMKGDVTLIAVSNALKAKGILEKCGRDDYLVGLVEAVSTSAGIEHHCQIIKNLFARRQIINQCSEAADQAFNLTVPISETISELKAAVRGMSQGQGKDYLDNAELIKAVIDDISTRAQEGNRFVGVKTGFENIDREMHGMEAGTTIYIIARPSIGKTALALNIADFVAENDDE